MQTERPRPVSTEVMALIRELAYGRNGQKVTRETRLLDIGFDSLACAEFAALVQERFGLDHTTLQVDRDHSTLIKLRPSPPRRGKPVGGQER